MPHSKTAATNMSALERDFRKRLVEVFYFRVSVNFHYDIIQ